VVFNDDYTFSSDLVSSARLQPRDIDNRGSHRLGFDGYQNSNDGNQFGRAGLVVDAILMIIAGAVKTERGVRIGNEVRVSAR
jgi:hypothetical protein